MLKRVITPRTDTLNALNPKPLSRTRSLVALLTLSLAAACNTPAAELEEIPLQVERTADTLRLSWEGDKVHRVDVIQCDEGLPPLGQQHCGCNGSVVWRLGAGESEKFEQVALEAPFIASPLQYSERPESDRKGYEARPLVAGKAYVVRIERVGPCRESPKGCQQTTAQGCHSFVW